MASLSKSVELHGDRLVDASGRSPDASQQPRRRGDDPSWRAARHYRRRYGRPVGSARLRRAPASGRLRGAFL